MKFVAAIGANSRLAFDMSLINFLPSDDTPPPEETPKLDFSEIENSQYIVLLEDF